MTATQILASLLNKLKGNFTTRHGEVCVTYPNYMTKVGRKALSDACFIARINNPFFISEATATVQHYAKNHIFDFLEMTEPRVVVFVDIGSSQANVVVAKYDKPDPNVREVIGTVLYKDSEETIGGRYLD